MQVGFRLFFGAELGVENVAESMGGPFVMGGGLEMGLLVYFFVAMFVHLVFKSKK